MLPRTVELKNASLIFHDILFRIDQILKQEEKFQLFNSHGVNKGSPQCPQNIAYNCRYFLESGVKSRDVS